MQVVELEMQLDEVREQYKLILRSTNTKSQQRRVEFMEYNLEALNAVQKQVSCAILICVYQADES